MIRLPFSMRLWRGLHTPPVYHALFRWSAERFDKPPPRPAWRIWMKQHQDQLTFAIGALIVIVTFIAPALFIPLIAFVPLLLALVYAVSAATLDGLRCCLRVAQIGEQARLNHMFDLIALMPDGLFAGMWACATGGVYYSLLTSPDSDTRRAWVARVLFILLNMLVPLTFTLRPGTPRIDPQLFCVFNILTLLSLIGLLLADDIFSLLSGFIIGLLVPMALPYSTSIRPTAAAIFLLLQIALYLLTGGIALVLLPVWFAGLSWNGAELLLLLCMQVGVFLIIRDLALWGIWRVYWHVMDGQIDPRMVYNPDQVRIRQPGR
jgi:hypothetical protein